MKDSACYVKIVEWSDEDGCYVGSSPGLFYGGCHGTDERQLFEELCEIVEETIELYRQDGKPCRRRPRAATLRTRYRTSLDTSSRDSIAKCRIHPAGTLRRLRRAISASSCSMTAVGFSRNFGKRKPLLNFASMR